ncbi:Gfo/Idh/MocA family oxidoreductase [Fontisphaera persica]|uniref:Gfo/Idh/MocA family protein n=1 Tax=Fontisphaera persica TaxID=2974023 RepID=UPI0024BFFD7D|nr:Gfo/Idh/MocA family oxidoreductase [Fontisphaera persica]WCJ59486.1 Gfo/Idh/MocA family oxidoreductase [Fontisphaera persica]
MNSASLPSRRRFLQTTSAAVVAAPWILSSARAAAMETPLKIGLVGCGGRGSGAALNALRADPNVQLTALGDVFEAPLRNSLADLQSKHPDKVKVTPEHCFVGLDAYKKVIESGVDVVLLATPPGFRPQHLAAAVAAGKHVFCEKPMATDAPGVRSVMESAKIARQKKLAIVAGFCWRYNQARREFYKRVHDGALGAIRAIYATYLTSPVKPMPPASSRPPGMGDVEWQLRNWYNFVWLSGDGLVEQACHSVDKIAWAMQDKPPLKAVANGGRNVPNGEGNIYDHIDVFYEYPNGVRAFMAQRQISNCVGDNSDYLMGEKGTGTIKGWNVPVIQTTELWRYRGESKDMYQMEHDELFASIRKGEPINDGEWMATSTLMAIMGRMAAYTGKEITWEMALNSKEQLVPENLTWDMKLPIKPLAVPGKTEFI